MPNRFLSGECSGFPLTQVQIAGALEAAGSTGPDIAGITDRGRIWPRMLLAVPRFDCQSESSPRQVCRLRHGDACGCCVDLLERRADSRIAIEGVPHGLSEREDGWRRRLRCLRRRQDRRGKHEEQRPRRGGPNQLQPLAVVRQNVVIAEPALPSAATPDRIRTCLN